MVLKKYFVLVTFSILVLSLVVISVQAEPVINTENSSNYLDYGSHQYYLLEVTGLKILTNYTVMVGTNTLDAYNKTFTAQSSTADIYITYDGTLFDIYNQTLTQLQVKFVNTNDNTVYFILYIDLKFNNVNNAIQWLFDKMFMAGFLLLSSIATFVAIKFLSVVF